MSRTRALFTRSFWLDAFERAVKTFAQTTGAAAGAGLTPILDVPWTAALAVGGTAAVLSVLSSVASVRVPGLSPASLAPAGV